jgi:hypothetical protein
MVDARDMQCPVCQRLFRTWHQVGAVSALCPYCAAEIALDGQAIQPPVRNHWFQCLHDMLVSSVGLGEKDLRTQGMLRGV